MGGPAIDDTRDTPNPIFDRRYAEYGKDEHDMIPFLNLIDVHRELEEAAYVAGLTAAGLDPGIALSATLLFRLLTFWLPTIPGYWAFNRLQKIGAL